jgi:hypothetical protein
MFRQLLSLFIPFNLTYLFFLAKTPKYWVGITESSVLQVVCLAATSRVHALASYARACDWHCSSSAAARKSCLTVTSLKIASHGAHTLGAYKNHTFWASVSPLWVGCKPRIGMALNIARTDLSTKLGHLTWERTNHGASIKADRLKCWTLSNPGGGQVSETAISEAYTMRNEAIAACKQKGSRLKRPASFPYVSYLQCSCQGCSAAMWN